MTDINFEALGRCQHLKTQFIELKGKRDRAFSEIKHSYTESSSSLPDSVHEFNTARLRSACDKIDALNIELMTTVDEYNKWAKEANLSQLKIIRPYQIPS
jgi:hypothetical protein